VSDGCWAMPCLPLQCWGRPLATRCRGEAFRLNGAHGCCLRVYMHVHWTVSLACGYTRCLQLVAMVNKSVTVEQRLTRHHQTTVGHLHMQHDTQAAAHHSSTAGVPSTRLGPGLLSMSTACQPPTVYGTPVPCGRPHRACPPLVQQMLMHDKQHHVMRARHSTQGADQAKGRDP
jgi:hypothetical protein